MRNLRNCVRYTLQKETGPGERGCYSAFLVFVCPVLEEAIRSQNPVRSNLPTNLVHNPQSRGPPRDNGSSHSQSFPISPSRLGHVLVRLPRGLDRWVGGDRGGAPVRHVEGQAAVAQRRRRRRRRGGHAVGGRKGLRQVRRGEFKKAYGINDISRITSSKLLSNLARRNV